MTDPTEIKKMPEVAEVEKDAPSESLLGVFTDVISGEQIPEVAEVEKKDASSESLLGAFTDIISEEVPKVETKEVEMKLMDMKKSEEEPKEKEMTTADDMMAKEEPKPTTDVPKPAMDYCKAAKKDLKPEDLTPEGVLKAKEKTAAETTCVKIMKAVSQTVIATKEFVRRLSTPKREMPEDETVPERDLGADENVNTDDTTKVLTEGEEKMEVADKALEAEGDKMIKDEVAEVAKMDVEKEVEEVAEDVQEKLSC